MNLDTLTLSEVDRAADRFASAMADDALHAYFFPDRARRHRDIHALYKRKLSAHPDECYVTSSALEGLAVWERPGQHGTGLALQDLVSNFGLVLDCGVAACWRMLRYQRWSTEVRDRIVRDPYWYLDVVVVGPDFQGRGFASRLIRPFLERAEAAGADVYLETQNEANVGVYERYGFRLVHTDVMSGAGFTQFCMVKSG